MKTFRDFINENNKYIVDFKKPLTKIEGQELQKVGNCLLNGNQLETKSKKVFNKILAKADKMGLPYNAEDEITEVKALTIYDKVTLRKTLLKEKSGWLSIDKETGRWEVEDKEPKDNFKEVHSVQDIRNYYGWRYNVATSITVAFKDLEAGRWDQSEVGR